MSDTYETKRDAACPKDLNMYCDDVRCGASKFWKAGADWQSKQQQYYLHSDDNYYWTPAAWAEYQSLKAKLDIAKAALDEILHAGNMAMQGKWDDTEIMKNLAYAALVKLNQPMSTEGDV